MKRKILIHSSNYQPITKKPGRPKTVCKTPKEKAAQKKALEAKNLKAQDATNQDKVINNRKTGNRIKDNNSKRVMTTRRMKNSNVNDKAAGIKKEEIVNEDSCSEEIDHKEGMSEDSYSVEIDHEEGKDEDSYSDEIDHEEGKDEDSYSDEIDHEDGSLNDGVDAAIFGDVSVEPYLQLQVPFDDDLGDKDQDDGLGDSIEYMTKVPVDADKGSKDDPDTGRNDESGAPTFPSPAKPRADAAMLDATNVDGVSRSDHKAIKRGYYDYKKTHEKPNNQYDLKADEEVNGFQIKKRRLTVK